MLMGELLECRTWAFTFLHNAALRPRMNTQTWLGTLISLALLGNSPVSKSPASVSPHSRWLYAKDSGSENCLDSCPLGPFGEFSFSRLKAGTYDLYTQQGLARGSAQVKSIALSEPNRLQRHSALADHLSETNSIRWDFGDAAESDDVKGKLAYGRAAMMDDIPSLSRAVPEPESLAAVSSPSGSARVLTAGRWSDLDHWEEFETLHKQEAIRAHESRWGWDLIGNRITIEINGPSHSYSDIPIELRDASGRVHGKARTNYRSQADAFMADSITEKMQVFAWLNGAWTHLGHATKGLNSFRTPIQSEVFMPVDLAFIVDATGSMGDEINYLKAELADIMAQASALAPCSPVRIGQVFYKDRGDEYLTRMHPFTNRIDDALSFTLAQGAGGGGDFPEAVADGLEVAIDELSWSPNALARIAFLILDAPPHDGPDAERVRLAAWRAAEKGIRLVPIVASGIDQSTEFLMKYLAAATGGEYLYINDDSGVGNGHLKPTGVENNSDLLNNQMVAIIKTFTQQAPCDQTQNQTPETRIEWLGDQQVSIKAFPNPCIEQLHVESNVPMIAVQLYNISGAMVAESSSHENKTQLPVHDLAPGVYTLHVRTQTRSYSTLILVGNGIQKAKP